jgi:hypothetical protein
MSLKDTIVSVARSYIGQEEIKDNQGFKNAEFQVKMTKQGWYKGAPWCAFLAKLIWHDAFSKDDTVGLPKVDEYMNGSALDTYHNFTKSAEFHVSTVPEVGAVVIWKEGNGPSGHAGVVISVDKGTFQTVEGNTNTDGSREGYIAAIKTRKLGQLFQAKGLNLVGFVHPIRIA